MPLVEMQWHTDDEGHSQWYAYCPDHGRNVEARADGGWGCPVCCEQQLSQIIRYKKDTDDEEG